MSQEQQGQIDELCINTAVSYPWMWANTAAHSQKDMV